MPGLCLLNDPAGELRHCRAGGELKLQIKAVGFGEGLFHCPRAFDPAHGTGAPAEHETAFLLSPLDELWQSLGKNRYRRDYQYSNQNREH